MSVGLERFPHLKTLELSLEIWVESVFQAMGEDKGSQVEVERHGCIQKRMGTHLVKIGRVCVCVCVCV